MNFGFSSVLSKKLLLEATLILTCGLVFSLEIEERINSVRWCRREAADTQLLLATNDKTIKVGNHTFTSLSLRLGCVTSYGSSRVARSGRAVPGLDRTWVR